MDVLMETAARPSASIALVLEYIDADNITFLPPTTAENRSEASDKSACATSSLPWTRTRLVPRPTVSHSTTSNTPMHAC